MDRICNVLVVEDDDEVRALLGSVLDHTGYRFTLTINGTQMREALAADEFDVAIIDISLRGGDDGFALAEVASEKSCGIILTTGDPTQRVRIEASGRRHLMKPFRMQTLTTLVDEILKDTQNLCVTKPRGDRGPLDAAA